MPTFEDSPDVLGQSKPAGTTLTDVATGATAKAPDAGGGTRIEAIVCCNQGAGASLIRISVALGGAADAAAQYLVYDKSVAAKDVYILTAPILLSAGDVIRCQSDTGDVSFNIFGTNFL